MDYKRKLKIRLYFAIGYIILGLAMIVVFNIINAQNTFWSSMGLALMIIGIARVRNHFRITKNEETIKKCEIAETDERNISIANRAKSISFFVYVIVASLSVIVLQLLEQTVAATIISYSVCLLVLIYWISYLIISKKS